MAVLTLAELAGGQRVLLVAVSDHDREALSDGRGAFLPLSSIAAAQLELPLDGVLLVPCEPVQLVELAQRLGAERVLREAPLTKQ